MDITVIFCIKKVSDEAGKEADIDQPQIDHHYPSEDDINELASTIKYICFQLGELTPDFCSISGVL